MRKYIAICVAAIVAAAIMIFRQTGDAPAVYRTASGVVWHTTYNITYESSRDLGDSIIAVTGGIDMSASMFNPRSVLSHINNNSSNCADSMVAKLLQRSQEINRETGGAFDPTIAPLMRLWKTQDTVATLPDEAAIDSVMQFVGMDKVRLANGNQVIKSDSRLQLDFNAIAKGLGCDEVDRLLKRNGVTNYLVEIGGDITASGVNERGLPWHVSIDLPIESNDTVVHSSALVLQLDKGGIATSGNYRNYKIVDGRKVAHIIDPRTGHTAISNLLSATVIATDCMNADAYATALMVMGLDRARKFADDRNDLSVVLIYADADDRLQVWRSPGVAKYEQKR